MDLGKRLPAVLVAVACAGALVVAVSGTGSTRALAFLAPGHWVSNASLGTLFHVDGATGNVDAQIKGVDADPGAEVVTNGTKGYVVGQDVTTVDIPTLSVEQTVGAPGEEGVAVRTIAGPYVAYPKTGTIARMGDPMAVLQVGGPFTGPVATPDGTVWLRRTDNGRLCLVRKDSTSVPCPVSTPGEGLLTVFEGKPAFIDTGADTIRVVGESELGGPVALGVDVRAGAVVAESEVSGRIPILDQGELHLVDPSKAREVVTVRLPEGEYAKPVSAGSVVALVDRKHNTLRTYDGDGGLHHDKPIPPETGKPRLTKGDDARVYVEGDKGGHVMVIGQDGRIADVPVNPQVVKSSTSAQPPPPETNVVVNPNPNLNPNPATNAPPVRQKPTPPPPPTIVASPPGAPGGVRAVPGPGSATVSWTPAPANGAPITAYTVTWSGGAVTVTGTSATLNGLAGGVSHTVSVRAANRMGPGPAATVTVVPQRVAKLVLSRGSKDCKPQYEGPTCYLMHVELSGFAPNTKYNVQPHSTSPTYDNPGYGIRTDANGNADFEAFDYVKNGDTVWVTIMPPGPYVESNRLIWGQW